jgi:DNA-binding winged helix-turn-helix (wHTH) protein
LLKLADLTARPDFQLGPMLVSPARRLVEGPGGYVHVEPLIMQVFLLLLDAGGRVVTREELFNQCWGGVYVGDDSLNRAIAKVRRIGAQIAPGLFEIETIPRTGYRLTGEILGEVPGRQAGESAAADSAPVSRRILIGGGAAVSAMAIGGAAWWIKRPRSDPRFDALMARSQDALQKQQFDDATEGFLKQAVRLRPDSAKAWGTLALLKSFRAQGVGPKDSAAAIQDAAATARKALALDPNNPNGLLAMFELEGSTLDWTARDRALRHVLSIDPMNFFAIAELMALVQAAGLNRESWSLNERAIRLEPLSSDLLGRRALKLWIAGRTLAADKVIDRVRDLYPTDQWSWWVRFLILALTDRAAAAQAMLDDNPSMLGPPLDIALWRGCLPALSERSTANIARARQVCFESAKLSGGLAAIGVMILSDLGQVDPAFEVADGFLLWRGPIVRGRQAGTSGDSTWRISTQWLFTPPCAVMRADARFAQLCDGIGLTEYWQRRGVKPDYQLTRR